MFGNIFMSFAMLLALSTLIKPQQFKMFNAGEAQMLPEIKGVVIFANGKVVIGPIPPADQRENEYKNLDLKSGDEIQFVNGKQITSINDFKKFYQPIKTGDEIKLGIKRGSDRSIVAFKKAEETSGKENIMTISSDGKKRNGKMRIEGGKLIIGGKKLDLDSLKKAGAAIKINKEK